jgi:AraC-like DNA-binding protein
VGLYELDLLIRGASLGVALVFALLLLRAPDPRLRGLGLGLVLASAAFQIVAGEFAQDWPDAARTALRMLAISAVYFFWALSRLMFEDRFALRPWHAALVAVPAAAILLRALLRDEAGADLADLALRLCIQLPVLALLAHALFRVALDRRDDLVEPRRRVRLLFVGAGACLAIATLLAHVWGPQPWTGEARLVQGAAYLALKLLLIALLLDFRAQAFVAATPLFAAGTTAVSPAGSPPLAPDPTLAADPALAASARDADRVVDAMQRDRVYREPGLTIGALAAKLDLPEYRLRRLINQHLGHRNFSDFLNAWRLREAAERLRDPAQAHLPILSIALDLGYGSIGPFNRAFKAALGLTPSDFRRGKSGSAPGQEFRAESWVRPSGA